MRPFLADLHPEVISHHGKPFCKSWLEAAGKQTTKLAAINLGILRDFLVPVAPAVEQRKALEGLRVQFDA